MIRRTVLIFLCLICVLGLCACTEIEMNENSVDNSVTDSSVQSDSKDNSEQNSTGFDESDSVNTSFDVSDDSSVDNSDISSEISQPESKPQNIITTNDYTYAITLSEEEINCINSGSDGKYMILVNKTNKLPDDYVPEELVDIRDTRKDRAPEKMTKTAEIALHAFIKEAAQYGYGDITITSGYRTFAKQQALYNNYVNNELAKGKDRESAVVAADKYSARPGTSEHHTGLAADMHNFSAASQSFGYTDAAKWLAANAHRFGFILRYPPDDDAEPTFNEVTTYIWEPWHFRFVGVHYATDIYESGLCFEEYLAQNGEIN